MSGYFLNVLVLKTYNKNKKNQTKVSKDSFLNFHNDLADLETKELLYNEMIMIDGNANISIVSKVLKVHKELYESLSITSDNTSSSDSN